MGQGKTLRVDVSRIIPKNLLPIVRKLFSFFFPFFVFFCLHHPVVVVHEIVLYSFICFSWLYEFIDVVSHLLLGLPTSLLVLILLSRPGCQSKCFLVHLSSGRDAILLAIRHFSLLCVSIQQSIFIFFMYALLLWYFS